MSEVPGRGGLDLNKSFYFVAGLLIVILDQVTKYAALNTLGLDGREVTVIPGLLWFHVIRNTGAAFGLFQSLGPLLAVITVMLIYAGYKIARHEENAVLLWSMTLIVGGAVGNLIDRVWRGGVIDFIQVPNWPLFNLADCAITLGTAGILIFGWSRRNAETSEPDASNAA